MLWIYDITETVLREIVDKVQFISPGSNAWMCFSRTTLGVSV